MINCQNCGNLVNEGKFCEKCGAPLTQTAQNAPINNNVCPNCGATNQTGKFCEKCGTPLSSNTNSNTNANFNASSQDNIFNKLNKKFNTVATNYMAIKSNYTNGEIIYMVNKIPNINEKKIEILNGEIAFFNDGNGFSQYNSTFITQSNNFNCFYIRTQAIINNHFQTNIKPKIKFVSNDSILNLKVGFDLTLLIEDVNTFFNTLISKKQNTWKDIDINSLMTPLFDNAINDTLSNLINNDGGIDLKDMYNQIKNYTSTIQENIITVLNNFGLKIQTFSCRSVDKDINELNNILIDYIYNNQVNN